MMKNKKKRILSVLLAAALLFTADGTGLYAMDMGTAKQNMQEPAEVPETPVEGEVQQYTVTFDLNGGVTETGESSFSVQVEEGKTVDAGRIEEAARRGYLFQGWRDAQGDYYEFDQPVMQDLTLHASWTAISYRVQFDLNGGEGKKPDEKLVYYDEEWKLSAKECYRKDYVLIGWEQEGVGIFQEDSAVKNLTDQDGAVVVLKAVWRMGEYKIRFDANGGIGTMEDEIFVCGEKKKLNKNKFARTGYTFAGWNTKKDGKGIYYKPRQSVSFPNQQDGDLITLYAVWEGISYNVRYDGNGAQSGSVSPTHHVYGTESKLSANHFKRKGYSFAGWNTQKDGKGKNYKDGVKTLTAQANGTVTLYARWEAVKYSITYHVGKGKLGAGTKKNYTITTKTFSLACPTRSGYDFDGWYKDAKYKNRVSEIKKGSTGKKEYYAKWVKCTRGVSKKHANITYCKAASTGKVKVKATVKNRVASSDDRYYLVYVNPYSGIPYKQVKKSFKKKKLSFTLKTSENQGYATAMYGIAVKKKGKYKLISKASFVNNPEKAAKNKSKYKLGKTKKGMQFYNSLQEITNCNAKNTFLNLTVSYILTNPNVPYKYNGKTYYFGSMDYYKDVVSECNKKGINVTMQILLDWVWGQTDLIDSRARKSGAAPYYTWNVRGNAGREKMEAMFCYVGSVFGKKKCCVSNWILGNEVNNPISWNYAGNMSANSYFRVYAQAFRSLYYAIRSQYANARIFTCMDNYWNTNVPGGYSVKSSISKFQKYLQKIQKGLKWNLAYHAYSAPLTYTNFWDGYGITNDANTPYITMKNLNVLTKYMKKRYGSSVRIILSEQGYSSSWGQANQAAAIAASYYIAACNPNIDAFIIRSYHDHPVEVAQGLAMGIYGKEAFQVFKYMDTSYTHKYTKRYLKLMGISSWKKLVPGYNKKRLYKMYRK